jgi:hypothetical protein
LDFLFAKLGRRGLIDLAVDDFDAVDTARALD